MISWLARRIGWSLLTLWLVVSATFALAYVLPADPARMIAGPHASPDVIEHIRHELLLDQPIQRQYAHFLAGVARGDLGKSYRTKQPVTTALRNALPWTAVIAIGASIVQLLWGLPIGLYSALRRDTWGDFATMTAALVGISAPTFLIGLGLLYVLGFQWQLFPIGGAARGLVPLLRSAALPSLTLGIAGAAYYSRLTRGEYLEVATRDFMRTAKAKGLAPSAIVVRHGLRNALVPIVTFFGIDLGTMLGGAVVTETIFAWPGLGKLAIDSVLNQDIPLILGTVLVASVAIVLANIVVDVAYAFLDPRIRLG